MFFNQPLNVVSDLADLVWQWFNLFVVPDELIIHHVDRLRFAIPLVLIAVNELGLLVVDEVIERYLLFCLPHLDLLQFDHTSVAAYIRPSHVLVLVQV